jgi:superfamily II DNA helicase RecQ
MCNETAKRWPRDGQESTCVLLYNSLLSSRCSDDTRGYLNNEECRRKELLKVFPGKHGVTVQGCKCCDVCAATCSCAGQSGKCSLSVSLETSKMDIDVHQFKKSRAVSDYQKSLVQSKLLCYMNDLRDKSVKPVLYPNIYF